MLKTVRYFKLLNTINISKQRVKLAFKLISFMQSNKLKRYSKCARPNKKPLQINVYRGYW
ncbi:MAG: hypothetical protein EBZ58_06455 [Bacteroidetes bacterium]|nr:hypothetical protein [Bacteroidota bacterium]